MLKLVITVVFISVIQGQNLVINTTTGLIRGKLENVEGKELRVWLGVPYAQPPIGNLRFRKPIPINRWEGIKDTTQIPNACCQKDLSKEAKREAEFYKRITLNKSEDCLVLNIHVPTLVNNKRKLSTLVWIHGGGFYKNAISKSEYDPEIIAAQQDVIVIAIQYRLGVLGLLYLRDERAPGNMGLMDQALALKWVYDNVGTFGGSKEDITLWGESAGAASIGFHLISNHTRHLFQKVIMQSGSPFCFWSYADPQEQLTRSKLFAKYAGCKKHNFTELIECLMTKSGDALVNFDKSILPLAPTIDGDFLTKDPFSAMQEKDFAARPILGGFVQCEGMPGLYELMKNVKKINYSDFTEQGFDVFIKAASYGLDIPYEKLKNISDYYEFVYMDDFGETDYEEASKQLFGDAFATCPTLDFFKGIRDSLDQQYLFFFNHQSEMDPGPKFMGPKHASEVKFQFGRPFSIPERFTDEDRNISAMSLNVIGNYTRNGKPDENWKPYNGSIETYSYIQSESTKYIHEVYAKEDLCKLWSELGYGGFLKAEKVKETMKKLFFLKNGDTWLTRIKWGAAHPIIFETW